MSGLSNSVKAIAVAAALTASASTAYAQSLSVNSEQAMAAVQAALKYSKKDGSDVSIAVVDREGKIVLLMRGDTAAPHNLDLARRKAYTANMFKMTSLAWRDKSMPGQPEASERRHAGRDPSRRRRSHHGGRRSDRRGWGVRDERWTGRRYRLRTGRGGCCCGTGQAAPGQQLIRRHS